MKQETSNSSSRRKFLEHSALAGAGLMFTNPLHLFSQTTNENNNITVMGNVKTDGYAGIDEHSPLQPWHFERRAVGDNDILIETKFSGICHSDIHTIRGHWGKQIYPQVVGHEIAGIVTAVGKNVTKFKVGDKAGVGCMVDSCMHCHSCLNGEEHHCETPGGRVLTYGAPDKTSPTGITQGGYSNNIVVTEHFAIKIPESMDLKYAAPLLCAGITTYSPLIKADFKRGDKIGVAGIGGLGHMAVKLAVAKGAEVYAFTTSPSKVNDIRGFGAKEVIVVNKIEDLIPWYGKMDYMISTIPYAYELSNYISCVRPYGFFTQVGQPINGALALNNSLMMNNRVNFNSSTIGGIPETQEVIDYCALNKIYPQVEVISANQINDSWEKVVNKEARYRYVIDATTFS
ncbi:MAG TPA: NAD(P)-dependent alcohol dehydrogenase [Agriterribacter sp.]|nr:NAD(P)-dependent alcohol dehydrogenase [Agriterribacter sp.]